MTGSDMPSEGLSYSVKGGEVIVWKKGDIVAHWPVGPMLLAIAKDMNLAKQARSDI